MNKKILNKINRKYRIRLKINGTASRPRLTVYRSNTSLYAQIIDDEAQITLASANWKELGEKQKLNIANATKLGEILAEKALKLKIDKLVFDRNGYLYHGKIKAVAEAVRNKGLKF